MSFETYRQKPRPTVLPYINFRTGLLKLDNPTVQEKILVNYSNYSHNYWLGVKERQKLYIKNLRESNLE
jgi:hypothetical protein